MIYHHFQSNLHYLQEHHQELIRAAEQSRLVKQSQTSTPKLRDRIYLALGERLIAWGQKLKDEAVFNELAEECCV